jgi:hypothetical protein
MVAMMTRIIYTHLLFMRLVSGDLTGSVDEGRDSSGRRILGVVGLVYSMIGLV